MGYRTIDPLTFLSSEQCAGREKEINQAAQRQLNNDNNAAYVSKTPLAVGPSSTVTTLRCYVVWRRLWLTMRVGLKATNSRELCSERYVKFLIITLCAKLSSAVYCYRSCLCVCNGRTGGQALFVCRSVTTITRNCVHRSSPNWVCRWR